MQTSNTITRTSSAFRRVFRLLGVAGAVLLSGCFLLPEDPAVLTVEVEGGGRVFSFGLDFNCRSSCVIDLPLAAVGGEFTVHVEARALWDFDSWGGRCAGETGTSCIVQYEAGTTGELVRAVFVPEP